ncbi:alpha/beta fold hydrolase [Spirillospora sp. NPDC052242]
MVPALAGHHHLIRVDLPGCGQSPPAESHDVVWVLLGPPVGPLLWSRRSDAMIRRGIEATAARPVDVPDDMVAELRSTTYRTFRAALRKNTAYIAERSLPDRLAALDLPVLVVFGAADPRWEPSSAHRYDAMPGARVETLPGVGHMPMLEAPEATGELLLTFAAAGR